MSADWPIITLGEVCLKITDGAHNSPKSVAVGKPMASVKDLTRFGVDLSEARHISPQDYETLVRQGCRPEVGDVLIAKDGNSALDTVCNVKRPLDAVLLSSVAILRPDQNVVDSDFLKFFLSSKETIDYLKSNFISGAAIPRVVLKDLKKAKIKLPPLETQKDISAILNSVDDKIELNRQINQTLEQIAQAIFKSWFVDFEPVKAKIEAKASGRDPERAAMCAISGKTDTELDQLPPEQRQQLAATAALFPDELAESELGLIPKGWEVSVIGKEVAVVGGGTPSTTNPDFWENGIYHWTTPKDLSGLPDKILTNTERKITEAGLAKISSGLLPVNTVLMSSRAPVGYLALAKVPVAVNQGYIAMRCEKRLPATYVLQWAGSVMDDIKQRASGTTFAEISKKIFKEIPVVSPDGRVLGSFSQLADDIYEKISGTLYESQALAKIRDTLLPKLLSGEIHAPDAEKVGFCS